MHLVLTADLGSFETESINVNLIHGEPLFKLEGIDNVNLIHGEPLFKLEGIDVVLNAGVIFRLTGLDAELSIGGTPVSKKKYKPSGDKKQRGLTGGGIGIHPVQRFPIRYREEEEEILILISAFLQQINNDSKTLY